MSFTLLFLLLPCSCWRLSTWLVQPAGSGVVRRTLGGVAHHLLDTALVTAWSWWSVAAVWVVMRPQLFALAGFTLRSVSLDSHWRHLTTLFKYTLFFWMAAPWRGLRLEGEMDVNLSFGSNMEAVSGWLRSISCAAVPPTASRMPRRRLVQSTSISRPYDGFEGLF